MRYHQVYRLVDPRYQLDDPKHIRYVGRTSERLSAQLDLQLAAWRSEGGPGCKWLCEMFQAGVKPGIIIIEKVDSASDAKERMQHWVDYYKCHGYELLDLDNRFPAWDRQRVTEDFRIEVMRLLFGQDSPYSAALKKLSEEGQEGSALYLYLQGAETPDLSIEEIPALFRERDERVKGLEHEVMRAIDSGEIQGPIVSALREAIKEGKQAIVEEEGSALERYVKTTEEQGDDHFVFYLGKEPSIRRRQEVEKRKSKAREAGWEDPGHTILGQLFQETSDEDTEVFTTE